MFKGIVIEIQEDYIIVMKEGGEFERIINKHKVDIGQAIFFFEEDIVSIKSKAKVIKFSQWIKPLAAIAALLIIMINPLINLINPTNNIYAVLTFDINPSIELELDKEGKIIRAIGKNDDGKSLDLNEVNGLTIEEGIKRLETILTEDNYLLNNSSLLVGFSFIESENLKYEEKIQKTIKDIFKTIDIAYLKGTGKDYKVAESKGISLGRYEALQKLSEDELEESLEIMNTQELLELLRNKDKTLFFDKEAIEEIEDELEDRLEDINTNSDDDNHNENDKSQSDDEEDEDDNDHDDDGDDDGDDHDDDDLEKDDDDN